MFTQWRREIATGYTARCKYRKGPKKKTFTKLTWEETALKIFCELLPTWYNTNNNNHFADPQRDG